MNKTLMTLLGMSLLATAPAASAEGVQDTSTRRERNYIVDGNKLYRDKRYEDAEVAYKKALEINPNNETALFNLASSYLRQDASPQSESFKEAVSILGSLSKQAGDVAISELSFYNLGNISFNGQDYAAAIEQYKNALRRNPDNDKARENLRLAQKRLEEQQNQNQNQKQEQNQDKQDPP
ncbi:MAG: tetratricopeptide repeat protein, partial [Duncaniella sp.]|nr:tetratricopeptide repeat protein [Duncaniella sp.]